MKWIIGAQLVCQKGGKIMLRFKATYWDEFIDGNGGNGDEHTVWGVCEGPSFVEATRRIENAFGKDLLSVEVMAGDDYDDEIFLIDPDSEGWLRTALSNIQRDK